ncbi:hypothetical protein [Bradyrhizobium sp. RT10b]|uniref:hypothetical protein n=1 Tax=Bradyrhizobium sp. RT10b TaxID=3156331 RepID=UPI0033910FD6
MSSTNGATSATTLRLASARRRVRAFLDQIGHLEASDFPHADGREALEFIKQHFAIRLKSLESLPPSVSEAVVREICTNTTLFLERHTEVLGFILRSTNVRNAFEVHFPLKRLVEQVISSEARLVMSSEWNFVPFTYPMNLNLLPDFVLVGGPAPESGNVLIVPLAGHEIGHSAWRAHEVKAQVQAGLTKAIDDVIAANPSERDRVLVELSKTGLDLSYLQNACLFTGVRQLEEVFCDLFGLFVFGEAYLYAYEYFLAPGGGARTMGYPSATDRVGYLQDAAGVLALDVDPDLFAGWQPSTVRDTLQADVLSFADAAVARSVPGVRKLVFELLAKRKVPRNRQHVVQRVMDAFKGHIPDGDGASLAEITTAGWKYLRDRGGLSSAEERLEHDMLNELMLKSIEVSEFHLRVGAHA